ncbi:uncharacterized protein LOC113358743 isoform X2 [Papaver somniferum]|uniref:uncharacterized protein LOC113358743 isoform X2 n=1 Tax=Papaver somniferum TaxID=3469 RepID=UPI000E6F8C19|nr:uncharacterized protein LOC113358743 isoform X2 [Papaver somniferum]
MRMEKEMMNHNEDVFNGNPRSFQLDRKSSLAAKLKSSISDKLIQLIGDHIDDVLAEYIMVLVCNGKHQHQARDDLEAFLGEKSSEFVSWLWDVLLRAVEQSRVLTSDLSSLKDVVVRAAYNDAVVDKEQRDFRLKKLHDHENGNTDYELSHSEKYRKSEVPGDMVSAEVNHRDIVKHDSSRVEVSSGNLSGGEKNVRYEGQRKIVKNSRGELFPRHQSSVERKFGSASSQSVMAEGPNLRLHPMSEVPGKKHWLSEHNSRPRGNVWDRLGKPNDDNTVGKRNGIDVHGAEVTRKAVAHDDRNPSSMVKDSPVHNNSDGLISETCFERRHLCNTKGAPNDANNSGRKRQFGETDYSNGSKWSKTAVSNMASKYPAVPPGTRANSMSLVAGPGAIVSGEDGNTNLKPVETDVKIKLHPVDVRGSELCSEHGQRTVDGHITSFSNGGAMNFQGEGDDSRTVFVTNVHFAATDEALASHFSKCGVIFKVIILRDAITGQPKGSAYITFGDEESVDRAVARSGSSFWSRTLQVMRKSELAGVVRPTTPLQIAGRLSQLSWFQQQQFNSNNVNLQRPYPGSHHQWRRDQQPVNEKNLPVSNSTQPASGYIAEHDFVDSADTVQMHTRSLTYVRNTQTQTLVAGSAI